MSQPDGHPRPHGAEPPRPRPQYGEYATPEEQRARIQVPDATAALSTGATPEAPRPSGPLSARAGARTAPTSRRATIDRVVTIALLGFGLLNVVTGIPVYLDYQGFAARFTQGAGIDATFTNVEQGRTFGLVAAIVLGALWLVTAVLAALRLRREKPAFWIPLVGIVVTAVVVGVILAVPLAGDPGIMGALLPAPAPLPTPTPNP